MDKEEFIWRLGMHFLGEDYREGNPTDLEHIYKEIMQLQPRFKKVMEINTRERGWSQYHLVKTCERSQDLQQAEEALIEFVNSPYLRMDERERNVSLLTSIGVILSITDGQWKVRYPKRPALPEFYGDLLGITIQNDKHGRPDVSKYLECLEEHRQLTKDGFLISPPSDTDLLDYTGDPKDIPTKHDKKAQFRINEDRLRIEASQEKIENSNEGNPGIAAG